MFIYADESGHTGKHIFNDPQFYLQGAILSITDPESLIGSIIESYKKKQNVERLHAKELPQPIVEKIAYVLLKSLSKVNWIFHITVIEKPYLSVTKFVDSIFDSGENTGVRWLWYNHEFFRHALCCFFDDLLSLDMKQQFWKSYLHDDYQGICSVVKFALDCLGKFEKIDARLKEVVKDGLTFALEYPEEITLLSTQTRSSYKGHTPNMVAFISLLQSVHKFCRDNDVIPETFIHDPQSEFGATMKKYHNLHSNVRINENRFGLPQAPERVDYGLGEFALKSSRDVASLQAVDLLLWLSQRSDGIEDKELRGLLAERIHPFYISRSMSDMIVAKRYLEMSQTELTQEQIAKAKKIVDDMEHIHLEKISEFKSKKKGE